MKNQQNKAVIVTGVSSHRGIGAAICRKLASQNFNIFFTYLDSEPHWEKVFSKEISGIGVACKGLEVDLSDVQSAEEVLESAALTVGKPMVLVNNAAHSTRDGYLEFDAKTMDEHYAVNMRAVFLLCTEFAKRFPEWNLPYGRIINMTSGQELGPMPGELAYASTKAAITSFTRSLATEIAHLGITANAINPGPTDSTWMNEDIRNFLLPKFPGGRIGQPEDTANLAAFLAGEDSRWITGQVIHSEGGFIRG
ncbi:oxidoreductase [Sporosarcina globispora]|uniref:Oxidoreductase n=1 Tax=Sporosarcina globispora TaxID=1459 RepID=A0A0M0GFZ1_SPOGL|nr:SDR family oxidoreductase [Sporosarcina globispora]KON88688.1 oxidoreductase [Sporosarcina globispora]